MDIFTLQFMGKVRQAQAESRLILLQLLSVHIVCCKIENALRVYVWSIQNMSRAFPLKGRDGKWQVFMLLTITNSHEEPIKQTKLSLFILTSANEYHQRLAMEI